MSDVIHVNAAGGDIGGDKDAVDAVFEALQRFVTLALGAVAVDARHFVFPALQKFVNFRQACMKSTAGSC
jgi:hypothetical protein